MINEKASEIVRGTPMMISVANKGGQMLNAPAFLAARAVLDIVGVKIGNLLFLVK